MKKNDKNKAKANKIKQKDGKHTARLRKKKTSDDVRPNNKNLIGDYYYDDAFGYQKYREDTEDREESA
jgi:hypothetical protein